ncbi:MULTISPECIES: Panacea domain-containing protein [Neisseria]|uniref:Panacea domain-containing protein n=1 Tax=Neisseria TaxID=482 RepID=UPI000D3D58B5|nr:MULTISPECIES: type II toxin-antitoxin system antitoxin SocA domain-containing protein [Neisseria]MBF0803610.1 DUF4065 domain-containing protein [Neisseria sp. 19428wB4_WF04]TFU43693.1 DUF4065 domain-containing protein [Neisseria sp. WF04]
MISIYALADLIVEYQKNVTNLKLQKLAYFCYGVALAKDIELLNISNPFEAWPYGPVNSDLYHSLKHFHNRDIPREYINYLASVYNDIEDITPEIKSVVHETLAKIGSLPAFHLVELSHLKGSPWDIAYNNGYGNGHIISDDLVRTYFQS